MVGSTTDAIADGIIRSTGETAKISLAQVKLFNEVRSIERLELLTASGQLVATLLRRINTDTTDYKQTFEAQVQAEQQVTIPKDTDVRLVLRAVIRNTNNGGFSDELLQLRLFSVTLKGDTSCQSINIPLNGPFKKHQTSFGRITGVTRVSPATATLISGTDVVISSYSFSGSAIAGKNIKLRQLLFSVIKNGSVTVSDWKIVHRTSGVAVPCTINETTMTVTCFGLEQSIGQLTSTPLILDLKATVNVPASAQNSTLETSLEATGSPESLGSIEWTDESGVFRWIEGSSPIVKGTRLQ